MRRFTLDMDTPNIHVNVHCGWGKPGGMLAYYGLRKHGKLNIFRRRVHVFCLRDCRDKAAWAPHNEHRAGKRVINFTSLSIRGTSITIVSYCISTSIAASVNSKLSHSRIKLLILNPDVRPSAKRLRL